MTPVQWKPLGIAAGAIMVVLVGVYGLGYARGQAKQAAKVQASELVAQEQKGRADALKAQAEAKDLEIAAKDAGLASARADVARKVDELARLRKLAKKPNESTPFVGELQPDYREPDNFIGISIKQDELIKSQANLIQAQEVKISALVISRDTWKQSAEAREREAAGLRIALEAQKSLTKGALWRGRFQGLAVGLGVGYVAGRLH